jgi:hypothetical protein
LARQSVEAVEAEDADSEDFDVLEQVCISFNLDEEQCNVIREAAEEYCRSRSRGKRGKSEYQVFMGECVKGKSGPVKERFRECAKEWRERGGSGGRGT